MFSFHHHHTRRNTCARSNMSTKPGSWTGETNFSRGILYAFVFRNKKALQNTHQTDEGRGETRPYKKHVCFLSNPAGPFFLSRSQLCEPFFKCSSPFEGSLFGMPQLDTALLHERNAQHVTKPLTPAELRRENKQTKNQRKRMGRERGVGEMGLKANTLLKLQFSTPFKEKLQKAKRKLGV